MACVKSCPADENGVAIGRSMVGGRMLRASVTFPVSEAQMAGAKICLGGVRDVIAVPLAAEDD